ncbi:DUF4177 domain-containing protein [Patescibacteria group bacterium]|nr:DUF4177 domain-containing protein [Patescibacteria group bacterium]
MKKQYKIELVNESALSTILLSSGRIPEKQLELVLNNYGAEGWSMDFMVIEKRRLFLFWARETVVLTFSRPLEA